MKTRYTVTDNKSGDIFNYTWFKWNLAFVIIFISGIASGLFISYWIKVL